jgi:hypothetical protein
VRLARRQERHKESDCRNKSIIAGNFRATAERAMKIGLGVEQGFSAEVSP